MKLFAAFATHGSEDISCSTRRVNPYKDWLILGEFAFYQCDVFLPVAFLTERNQTEMSELGWHIHLFTFVDNRFGFKTVCDKVFYADNFDIEFLGNLHQFGKTRHGAVFVNDFDQCSCRIQTGKASQVYGSFGMSGTAQYTTRTCPQGIDVSGSAKIGWFGVGVGQCQDGLCPIIHGNAGCTAVS